MTHVVDGSTLYPVLASMTIVQAVQAAHADMPISKRIVMLSGSLPPVAPRQASATTRAVTGW